MKGCLLLFLIALLSLIFYSYWEIFLFLLIVFIILKVARKIFDIANRHDDKTSVNNSFAAEGRNNLHDAVISDDKENPNHNIDVSSKLLSISGIDGELDYYFIDAGKLATEKGKVSIGMLQRTFKIGFNRASRIMDQLSSVGIVSSEAGTKPKKALISYDEFNVLIKNEFSHNFDGLFIKDTSLTADTQSINAALSEKGLHERITLYNNKFDYMTGYDFECYCADLLLKNGFDKVEITPVSGDFGADILAWQNGVKYAIQCKCYSKDIGVDAVYQISGGTKYYDANIGVVLTNRYFTSQASELAKKIGVILWDRDFLNQLIQNIYEKDSLPKTNILTGCSRMLHI